MDQSDQQNNVDAATDASVMRKKALAGAEFRQSQVMSLAKALRITLAKVANEQLEMAMAVIGVRLETCADEALGSLFEGDGLLMLLDGSNGKRAAAVFDPDLVGALIQQQTMGKVSPPLGGDPRPMTLTDAAICAPFLDALLSRAAPLPEAPQERALIHGYSFGARVENARLMLMALEEPAYEVVHLTVDVAGGLRQGRIMLCLPCVQLGQGGGLPVEDEDADTPREQPRFDKNVLALNAELNVSIASLRMQLSAVQSVAVGDVFDLGITAFDQATVQTVEGRRVSRGVLGQINGTRALQLEHKAATSVVPRRRATDRDGLNLPKVQGDGTGTQSGLRVGDLSDLPDLPDLPDVSLDLDAPMDQPAGLPGLSDLGDLPDMSDLPGFGDDDMLLQNGTG